MAGYGSRVNTYTTGDTIKAEDTNEEFDQLVSAFHETTGHTHDGTTDGDGAAITSLPANVTVKDDIKLYFGTGGDAYIEYDEDGTDTWDFSPPAGGMKILDDKKLYFGTGSDISMEYDEDGEDRFRIEGAPVVISGGEGEAGDLHLYADQGDDAGDEWKISVADGGIMTWGNDKNSAGTYVTHMTMTPHANVASSTVAFAGGVTIAGDLTITGDDLTMGTNTAGHILVADGTNYNPVAISGDVTINSAGAVTIANQAVENAMLADDAVGADELAANAVVNASVASGAAIDVSKTALTAGTNISLSTNTLNVDDAFLINSGDDTTSGVVTSAGYKLNVGAGSGDITTQFQQGGTTLFTVGIDDSDSEKFKIHSGTALADTSDLEITSAGVVSLASDLNVGGNTVLTGNLTVNGTTTTVNTATMGVVDPIIHLQTASDGGALGSDTNKDVGIVMQYHNGSAAKNAFLGWDDSASKLTFVADASLSSEVVSGSVGTIVATFEGNITGNVTGNTSGTAATVTTAAQSNITSLGTLTTLTVDDIIINGTNIGHTSDTDAIAISSGGVVTFSQVPLFPNDTIETADIQADAVTGAKIADDAIDSEHYTDGSVDLAHISTGAKTEVIAIACGDETTATAAATAVVTFHMPYAFYLTGIKAGVTTAPVGSVLTVDLNEAGSTCLTTKLTIDASEKTSATAATAAVIGGAGPALAADALMTIDVDGVGSSTAGAGLKVYLIGYQT